MPSIAMVSRFGQLATLVVSASLVAPASSAPAAIGRFQRTLDDYAQRDRGGQERWLSDLLRLRSELACHLTMSAEQLAAQQARHAAVLARVHGGQQLSAAGLLKLLEQVDAQENAAIDKLSRDYQVAMQRGARADSIEPDAWRNIQDRWLRAGRPWEQQPKLIHWLCNAIVQENSQARTEGAAAGAAARTAPPATSSATPAGPTVDANELSARIASYNLELAGLIARLHGQPTWSAKELEAIMSPLTDLVLSRTDLSLWWEVLPRDSRWRIKRPQPIEPAMALVSARTAAARRQLEDSAGDGNARELQILDRVSRRLALLAMEQ